MYVYTTTLKNNEVLKIAIHQFSFVWQHCNIFDKIHRRMSTVSAWLHINLGNYICSDVNWSWLHIYIIENKIDNAKYAHSDIQVIKEENGRCRAFSNWQSSVHFPLDKFQWAAGRNTFSGYVIKTTRDLSKCLTFIDNSICI